MNNQNIFLFPTDLSENTELSLTYLLEEATILVKDVLHQFTYEPDFTDKIQLAFGENINESQLKTSWQAREFAFPQIEVVSASEINGANGAFAKQTNKVYLAQEFLLANTNNLDAVSDVVLEEYGHFVDSQLNINDTSGDEGAIFTALVQGEELTESKLQQLKNENDSVVAIKDGESIAIEQQNINIEDYAIILDDTSKKARNFIDLEISGNNVVWSHSITYFGFGINHVDSTIYLYDGNTTIELTNDGANNSPDIDKNRVVWQQTPNSIMPDGDVANIIDYDSEILFYDGDNTVQLTNNNVEDSQPHISGDNIVWYQSQENYSKNRKIILYNLEESNTIENIDNGYIYNTIISENNLIWVKETNDPNTSDLYLYKINNQEKIKISSGQLGYAAISENNIIWSEYDSNYYDIFLYNINTQDTIQVKNNADISSASIPEISENNIIWSEYDSNDYEIFLYNINTQDTIQLTNNDVHDYKARIDGNQIAWYQTNNQNINSENFYSESNFTDEDQLLFLATLLPEELVVNTTEDKNAIYPKISPDASEEEGLQVTLRSLIQYANKNPDFNQIKFDISEDDPNYKNGIWTIDIDDKLPSLTIEDKDIVIDAEEQKIEVTGGDSHGFIIDADNVTIKDLTINNFERNGIWIRDGKNATIKNNKIGTDVTGELDKGNDLLGIFIEPSSDSNTIQGGNLIQNNVISGNGNSGVGMTGGKSTNNQILFNFIGTNTDGTKAIGNDQNGVSISDLGNNLVEGNTISSNKLNGIEIETSDDNLIKSNIIGLDDTGTKALGNQEEGILIESSKNNRIEGNTISSNQFNGIKLLDALDNEIEVNNIGTDFAGNNNFGNKKNGIYIQSSNNNKIGDITKPDEQNIIAFNQENGIAVKSGTGNIISVNSIFKNKELAIDLANDDSTENDLNDADTGANNLQNYPTSFVKEIEEEEEKKTVIEGELNSTPNTTFRIEIFKDDGKEFVDFINVTTDENGNGQYIIDTELELGTPVIATATNLETNDTSEFPVVIYVEDEYITIEQGKDKEKTLVFTVKLSQPSNEVVKVNYKILNGTAIDSGDGTDDYQPEVGDEGDELTLTFQPGQDKQEIKITVYGDTGVDEQESSDIDPNKNFEIFARDTAYRVQSSSEALEEGQDIDIINGKNSSNPSFGYEDLGYRIDKVLEDNATGFQAYGLTSDETLFLVLKDPQNATIANDIDGQSFIDDFKKSVGENKSIAPVIDPKIEEIISTEPFQPIKDAIDDLESEINGLNNGNKTWTIAQGTIYDLGKPPVLAVRGTEPGRGFENIEEISIDIAEIVKDIFITDLNSGGVGLNQYEVNKSKINEWLNEVSNPEEDIDFKPHVTGHSLGGALSQLIASGSTVKMNKVVTYNSPGISEEQLNNSQTTSATHYITSADFVSMAGETFLSGEYILSSYEGGPKSPLFMPGDKAKHSVPVSEGLAKVERQDIPRPEDLSSDNQIKKLETEDLSRYFFTYLPDSDYFGFQVFLTRVAKILPTGLRQLVSTVAAGLTFRGTTELLRSTIGGVISEIFSISNIDEIILSFDTAEAAQEASLNFSAQAWETLKELTFVSFNPFELNEDSNSTIDSLESTNLFESLQSSLQVAQELLKSFTTNPEFDSKMELAFGENYDVSIAQNLAQQWSTENFSALPEIQIVSASEIQGANGAFSLVEEVILISSEYLNQNANNPDLIAELLLEEIGHYVDTQINELDAPGDEGEIFAAVVQDISLTPEELQALKNENDIVVPGLESLDGSTPVDTFWEAIPSWSVAAWEATSEWSTEAWEAIAEWLPEAWDATTTWTDENWQTTTEWTPEIWQSTTQFTPEQWENIFRILSIEDLVTTPDSTENLSLTLDNPEAVKQVEFELSYDNNLLEITGVNLNGNLPDNWQLTTSEIDNNNGIIKVSLGGTDALTGNNLELVNLDVTVPDTATYGASQILDLQNVEINNNLEINSKDGTQVVAEKGDVTGDRILDNNDAYEIMLVSVGLDSSFKQFANIDPILLADLNGDNFISAFDAYLLING